VASIHHSTNIVNSSLLTIHSEKTSRAFTKGVKVTDPRPRLRTGAKICAQIDALVPNEEGGFVGYGEQHMWTHKSDLTRLPYFDDLYCPHNIDVMHTEKNITKAL
jgi:hypothetical protein